MERGLALTRRINQLERKTTVASNDGLQMIRWAVQFVLERGDHSWSLENVATKATRTLFSELEAAYPERVAWAVFDSADLGAPQSRVRLIAGPKKLIRMLQGIPCSRRVSIRDAFAERGEVTPANYCKNQTRSHGGDPTLRTVETTSLPSRYAPATPSHGVTPTGRRFE